MYESKFVKIDLKSDLLSQNLTEDYHELIEDYIKG